MGIDLAEPHAPIYRLPQRASLQPRQLSVCREPVLRRSCRDRCTVTAPSKSRRRRDVENANTIEAPRTHGGRNWFILKERQVEGDARQFGDGRLEERLDNRGGHAEACCHHREGPVEVGPFANPDDSQTSAAAIAQLTGSHNHRWYALDCGETKSARLGLETVSRRFPKQYAEG
jgi:hypothetical protein